MTKNTRNSLLITRLSLSLDSNSLLMTQQQNEQVIYQLRGMPLIAHNL